MGIEFLLFVLLGLAVFLPLAGNGKLICMVLFVLFMAIWLVGGFAGWPLHFQPRSG